MKVLTIIVFLGMVQLAQLALAETYNCPAGQTNALEPGQTIQTSGQPRCDKATGFSEGLCPTGPLEPRFIFHQKRAPRVGQSTKCFTIVRIRGFQLNTHLWMGYPYLSAVRHVIPTNLKVAAGLFRATAPLTSKGLGLQEQVK